MEEILSDKFDVICVVMDEGGEYKISLGRAISGWMYGFVD